MKTKRTQRILWAAVTAFVLLCLAGTQAWSDVSAAFDSHAKKTCYCDCDKMAGSAMCKHMCELPKYQGRWWAASCSRKQGSAPAAAPQQHSNSSRSNRVQSARL